MIKAGVMGAAGYTGQELLGILLGHPEVDVAVITSETYKGKALSELSPKFAKSKPLVFEAHDPAAIADQCDVVFLCLPHTESMKSAPALLAAGVKVIDLSADFRLKDAGQYEQWYKVSHTAISLLDKAVYGLPELYKGQLASADLIAAPGCYPTSAILALAPVMDEKWLDTGSIVVNSVSGVSGAGRKAAADYMLAELEGNFYAYGAPNHRHTPEIEQELSNLAPGAVTVTFIPHLLPTTRGIYTTVTANMNNSVERDTILGQYRAFYRDSRFVNVVDGYPRMKWAANVNGAFIGVEVDKRNNTLIVTSTLDNLVKGASGQAVQCFNIRHGLDEGEGLA